MLKLKISSVFSGNVVIIILTIIYILLVGILRKCYPTITFFGMTYHQGDTPILRPKFISSSLDDIYWMPISSNVVRITYITLLSCYRICMIILEVSITPILTGFRNSVILYLQCSKMYTKSGQPCYSVHANITWG